MAAHVFVQLYIKETGKIGYALRVPTQPDLYALEDIVFDKMKNVLPHCAASQLVFYKPGTEYPPKEEDKLKTRGERVPQGSTEENPIRVVAPARTENQFGKNLSRHPSSCYLLGTCCHWS